jgi:hypothetical protein
MIDYRFNQDFFFLDVKIRDLQITSSCFLLVSEPLMEELGAVITVSAVTM